MAMIHDVATKDDWEAACADPECSIIFITADIEGPLVYTGRNVGPGDNTMLIAARGGRVLIPEYPRGAIEFPSTTRGIVVTGDYQTGAPLVAIPDRQSQP